jgi:hypothetical protein
MGRLRRLLRDLEPSVRHGSRHRSRPQAPPRFMGTASARSRNSNAPLGDNRGSLGGSTRCPREPMNGDGAASSSAATHEQRRQPSPRLASLNKIGAHRGHLAPQRPSSPPTEPAATSGSPAWLRSSLTARTGSTMAGSPAPTRRLNQRRHLSRASSGVTAQGRRPRHVLDRPAGRRRRPGDGRDRYRDRLDLSARTVTRP